MAGTDVGVCHNLLHNMCQRPETKPIRYVKEHGNMTFHSVSGFIKCRSCGDCNF